MLCFFGMSLKCFFLQARLHVALDSQAASLPYVLMVAMGILPVTAATAAPIVVSETPELAQHLNNTGLTVKTNYSKIWHYRAVFFVICIFLLFNLMITIETPLMTGCNVKK